MFFYIFYPIVQNLSLLYIKQKNCDNNLHAITTVSLIYSYYE